MESISLDHTTFNTFRIKNASRGLLVRYVVYDTICLWEHKFNKPTKEEDFTYIKSGEMVVEQTLYPRANISLQIIGDKDRNFSVERVIKEPTGVFWNGNVPNTCRIYDDTKVVLSHVIMIIDE